MRSSVVLAVLGLALLVPSHAVAGGGTSLNPFQFVNEIRVGTSAPCDSDLRACVFQPIVVSAHGIFPNPCMRIRRFEVVQPPYMSPLPHPPILRILVDNGGCPQVALCVNRPTRWSASLLMPGLPAGNFALPVVYAVASCTDSFPTDTGLVSTQSIPFTVDSGCTNPPACLIPTWADPPGGTCNAQPMRGVPATLDLGVQSWAPLAGLQGKLAFYLVTTNEPVLIQPGAPRIVSLEPIGPAAGMHIQYTSNGSGVQFVMFADRGAPIPAAPPDYRFFSGVPILRVGVAAPDSGVPPSVVSLHALEFLGSDSLGGAVPACALPPCIGPPPEGHICFPSATCDVNHDGSEDVRDLVQLVHCVLGTGPCPDYLTGFDCNGDGQKNIDDVLCCGAEILHGHVPDSTTTRPASGVHVTFGVAERAGDGVDVPVHIVGADFLGAARLALSFPTDRFRDARLDAGGVSQSWLAMGERVGDPFVVGLVNIAGNQSRLEPQTLDFVVHLVLASGASPDGVVAMSAADFSGNDGVALAVADASPSLVLGGRPGLSLARPNPFSGETRFTLDLPTAASVDVAVHDLAGRRVATVFRGTLTPGARAFVWNGHDDHGGAVRDGVYFVRCVTNGRVQFQRVVLLRGR
jgi:FlgD Ig-like domain